MNRGVLLLGVVLAALGLGWGLSQEGLAMEPMGCAVTYTGARVLRCELPADRRIKLLVGASAAERLMLLAGWRRFPCEELLRGAQERLVECQIPEGTKQVRALALGRGRIRWGRVQVQDLAWPPWLRSAWAQWESNDVAAASAQLERERGSTSVPHGALAAYLLARIHEEAARYAESRVLAEQALRLARQADMGSLQLELSQLLSLIAAATGEPAEAERYVAERQPLLRRLAYYRAYDLLRQAFLRRERGDLSGAMKLSEEGVAWARRFRSQDELGALRSLRAEVLQIMGRAQEADREFGQLAEEEQGDCRKGEALHQQGVQRVLLLRALRSADRGGWRSKLNPLGPLRAALAFLTRGCSQPARLAGVHTSLAESALLDEDVVGAQDALVQAQQQLGPAGPIAPQGAVPERELQQRWTALRAELALLRKDGAAALAHARALERLATNGDTYEYRWQALLVQGLAHRLRGDLSAAELRLREAERYLNQRSLDFPLGVGRGTFLGQYERGTSQLIDLLVEQGRAAPAMEVLRQARGRGLRELRGLAQRQRLDQLSGERQGAFRSAQGAYLQLREQLDRLDEEMRGASQEELPPLERQRLLLGQRLLGQLGQALAALGLPAADTLSPPADGELLLGCYHNPADPSWWCLAQDPLETRASRVQRLESILLAPELGPLIERARRLRVLASGALRRVDVHRLPYAAAGEAPLGDVKEVVYALDLPPGPAPSAPALPARALALVAPTGSFPALVRMAPALAEQLTRLGFAAVLQVGGERARGGWPGAPLAPAAAALAGGAPLRQAIAGADLFLFAGHGDFTQAGGWLHRLRTANEAGLWVGDVLALPQVPPQVLLLGCESGRSDEEIGGQEGLGVAQAFLLRGAREVLAAVRPVTPELVAALTPALFQERPRSLSRALRQATQALARGTPADLGAFRIFVP